ncbi:hypothetical protein ACFVJM_03490 [Streptomyces virginiae]|uniref:hypothetical protein n=1 Tax=Streptomyces virginiae TaxID=1961 RepID=UPI003636DF33
MDATPSPACSRTDGPKESGRPAGPIAPYTSHRLHWFPYEITRCSRLLRSTVSTCSDCDGPPEGRELHQRWISRVVATDVLPLLVNACPAACVAALPPGAAGHAPGPHRGGWEAAQPPGDGA